MRGLPAEFVPHLRRVNGVTAVVAGAVFYEGDEAAGISAELRGEFVHEVADEFHDGEVCPFVLASDAVGLPGASPKEHLPKGLRVVGYIEPVAHVQAVAIDGDGLAGRRLADDHRDELLRELTWAVVI